MGSFEAIAEYLRRPNHLDQKDIQLTEREFNDLIPILRDAIRRPDRKLRTFTYDPMRGVLTLIAMSRPLHDAVRRFLSKTTMNWMAGGFLSETELEHVSSYTVGSLLLRIHPSFISSKLPAWTKYPDGALFFEAPSDDDVPVVIWKVGFSENYAALVDDATQWLCRSEGAVRLMILVKLDEDTTALQDTRKTNACKQRLRKLAVQFGNEAGKSEFGIIDSQHQPEDIPDAEQYECLKDKLVVEDWVGPLSAFLEFWVLSASGKAVKRGKRTVSSHILQIIPPLPLFKYQLLPDNPPSPSQKTSKPEVARDRYHSTRV